VTIGLQRQSAAGGQVDGRSPPGAATTHLGASPPRSR
jgi:hypothetical protein